MEELISAKQTYLLTFSIGVAFLFLRTFHLPVVPFAVNGDEILFFSRALRLVHGQVLYRDVFELVTPGTELLYALGFWIFGVHGWLIQTWHIVLGTALCLVITSIARTTLAGPAVFLPMLFFLAFDLSSAMDATHHWWSTLCALSAVAILIRGRERWRIVACGGLCGLATLFTQTQGATVFIAVVVFLAIEELKNIRILGRRLTLLTLPYLVLCAAVLGYYCYVSGAHQVFFDLVVFPLTKLSGPMNSPRTYLHQFPSVHGALDLFRLVPYVIILALTPYIYLFSIYALWRRRGRLNTEQRSRVMLLTLVGLGLFVAISSGPRFFRICTVAPPALLVFSWLLQQEGGARRFANTALWSLAGVFVIWLPVSRQLQWHRTLQLPIGKVAFTDPGQWQEFQWIQQRTSPNDRMFNNATVILYLSLKNPMHTEFVNNDDFTSSRDVELIIDQLKKNPPKYVASVPGVPKTSRDHAEPYRAYIRDHYCLERSFLIGREKYSEEFWRPCLTDRTNENPLKNK